MSSQHSSSDFFKSNDGLHPLKFRIQPGFSSTLQFQLEDAITAHGGTILSKIPVHGLVVIDPKSRTGRELLLEWAWPERPFRFFVSYTYVLACVDAGRLLPLMKSALKRESTSFGAAKTAGIQVQIPSSVKEQLACYLASLLPKPSSGNRSSNALYMNLIEQTNKYPWAEGFDWKALRTEYCRNKESYDEKIARLASDANVRTSLNTSTPQTDVAKQRSKKSANSRSVGSGKKLLIERTRKFASDVTNLKGKRKCNVPQFDDMRTMTAQSKARKKRRVQAARPDHADVEIGRHAMTKEHVWIDEEDLRVDFSPRSSQPASDSLGTYSFDSNAFGPARMLADAGVDEEGTFEDEHTVEDILGLSTIIEVDTPEDASATAPVVGSFAADVAVSTRFTVAEVEEKFVGFSGDVDRTRAFFVRCRSLVNDLYCARMNEAITSASGRMTTRGSIRI